MQQDPSWLSVRIFVFQVGNLLTKSLCGQMRLFRMRAVLGQLIQRAGDIIQSSGVGIENRNAECGKLIQHSLRIATAPGKDQIRL
ncbi:hypothetical protein D3C87_1781190 [compost metagenome]